MKRLVFVPVLVAALACALPGVAGREAAGETGADRGQRPAGDGEERRRLPAHGHDLQHAAGATARPGCASICARAQTTSRGSRRATASGSAPVPSATSRSRPWSGSAIPAASYDVVACVKRRGNSGNDRCRAAAGKLEVEGGGPGPVFTPGARTLGDPLLPQIGNGGYDVAPLRDRSRLRPGREQLRRGDDDDHRGRDSEPVASSASTSRTCRSTRCASTAPTPASAAGRAASEPLGDPTIGDPADEAGGRPGGRDPRRCRVHGRGRLPRPIRRPSSTPTSRSRAGSRPATR